MKDCTVFKKISVETGHPDNAVNNITEQLEDMGFHIRQSGGQADEDNVVDGVKNYMDNIEAIRTEYLYREKTELYNQLFWICLASAIFSTILIFYVKIIAIFAIILFGVTIFFWKLTQSIPHSDYIYIKVDGKIYAGTKAKEIKDSGKNKSGTKRSSASIYVTSDLKFNLAGESEIDDKRIRQDINRLSKYIQKI
ncbi:MAG: hypothetical protein ACOCQ4_00345 [bacterium]